jgi:hypothetical protein
MKQTNVRSKVLEHKTTAAGVKHRRFVLALIICASSLLPGCTEPAPRPSARENPIAAAPPPAKVEPAQAPSAPQSNPPDPKRVDEAVRRVFKDTAIMVSAATPSFVAGDFNGDLSPDIAVFLKPATGKLSEINEEHPAWILRDLATPNEPSKPRPTISENEVLLAVIHGYGTHGWSDPQATQTFLLKNAAGSLLQAVSGKEFVAGHRGKSLPTVQGDLIAEVLKGKSGYLYYDTATYSWYDPNTFKGEAPRSAVHSKGMAAKAQK